MNSETLILELPFSEHVEELRQRISHIFWVILLLTCVAFFEVKVLVQILELPVSNVKFFQLRLKNIKANKLLKIAKDIRKITFKHKVKFIINDNFIMASETKADGCHMGQLDGSIKIVRKKLRNKNFN